MLKRIRTFSHGLTKKLTSWQFKKKGYIFLPPCMANTNCTVWVQIIEKLLSFYISHLYWISILNSMSNHTYAPSPECIIAPAMHYRKKKSQITSEGHHCIVWVQIIEKLFYISRLYWLSILNSMSNHTLTFHSYFQFTCTTRCHNCSGRNPEIFVSCRVRG